MKQTRKNRTTIEPVQQTESSASFETSNIAFGNLKIVINSMNSISTLQSFYDNTPEISNKTDSKTIFGMENMSRTITDIKPCSQKIGKNDIIIDELEYTKNEKIFCWWCRITSIYKNNCCFLPVTYNEKTKKYVKHGYFCSWLCVKAYNFELNDSKTSFRNYLIGTLCKQVYGIKKHIKHAPHWYTLSRFGGTIGDDEYIRFIEKEVESLKQC